MAHQLLLALARVVSTKVYLSSKGVGETARQHATTWRQRFLQSGVQGTSIVFRNASTHEALTGFRPLLLSSSRLSSLSLPAPKTQRKCNA